MKLSISNIAWTSLADDEMYSYIQNKGFSGLEIAPTRIFCENPYDKLNEAKIWSSAINEKYGLEVSSMQSIWYGKTEKIFNSSSERKILIDYTKKAINFAETIGCKNLVFGCPKNRDTSDVTKDMKIAIDFFKEIGDYALEHNTIIAIEPNPTIYNTRFINNTEQAVEMAYKSSSKGIKINVDLGAIIYNVENIDYLKGIPDYINHVHISEPGLVLIRERELHKELFKLLKDINYQHFISIEMGNKISLNEIKQTIDYIKKLDETIQ